MWQSNNNFHAGDFLHYTDLNNLANDIRTWGGDVNGGGYTLNNVKLGATGGFQYYASPMEIVSAADGSARTQYDQTVGATQSARWSAGKDGSAESGGNAGSNYTIARYSDAGALIDTPISINRASGVISLGAQQWTANVNGGGKTLSNVVIPGMLSDPTTTQGDMIVRGASGLTRVPPSGTNGWVLTYNTATNTVAWAAPPATGVPTTRMVNTGLGLSGGGSLAADLTIVGIVFKPSGAGSAAGLVPDPGAPAGATRFLREDCSWAVPAGGSGGGGSPGGNTGDIQYNSSGAFAANSSLHWDITNFRLGIGTSTPLASLHSTGCLFVSGLGSYPTTSGVGLTFYYNNAAYLQSYDYGASAYKPLYVQGGPVVLNPPSTGGNVGIGIASPSYLLDIQGSAATIRLMSTSGPPIWIVSGTSGAGACIQWGKDGTPSAAVSLGNCTPGSVVTNDMLFGTYISSGSWTERMRLSNSGNFGIGTSNPANRLHVVSAADGLGGGIRVSGSDYPAVNSYIIMSKQSGLNTYGFIQVGDSNNYQTLVLQPNGAPVGIGTSIMAAGAVFTAYSGVASQQTSGASAVFSVLGIAPANAPANMTFASAYYNTTDLTMHIECLSQGVAWRGISMAPSGGNVGIGTTVAPTILTVCGNRTAPIGGTPSNTQVFVGGMGAVSTTIPSGRIAIGVDHNQDYGAFVGSMYFTGGTGGVVLGYRQGGTDHPLIYGNASYPDCVGIGTSTPSVLLSLGTSLQPIKLAAYDAGGTQVFGVGVVSGALAFGAAINPASGTPQMTLDTGGNLNISGQYRVNGVAIATSGLTTWATYNSTQRAQGSTYQNTTGKPLFVQVYGTYGGGQGVVARCDASNPPNTMVYSSSNSVAGGYSATASFWVLPGFYYQLSGGYTLGTWAEWN